jgi:hypothetical protein
MRLVFSDLIHRLRAMDRYLEPTLAPFWAGLRFYAYKI